MQPLRSSPATPILGLALAVAAMAGLPRPATAATLYATSAYIDSTTHHATQDQFGTLDTSTGVFTSIFTPATDGGIFALGYGTDHNLYGVALSGEVYRIDPTAMQVSDVGNVGNLVVGGEAVNGIFNLVSPDVPAKLWTYDPVTATVSTPVAMTIANAGGNFSGSGLVATGPGGTLYVSGSNGNFASTSDHLYTVDTATGVVTDIGDTGQFLYTGAFIGNTLYALDANNTIWTVDTTTGALSSPTDIIGFNSNDFAGAVVAIQGVPEGSSLAMLAIGVVGTTAAIRRRRR